MDKEVAEQKLQRLALEVAEQLSGDEAELVLVAVHNSGMVIAERINFLLKDYLQVPERVLSVMLDKSIPAEIKLSDAKDFNGKNILLIDDVCNSGKTLLYAMKPLLEYHPKRIQILVLVERMNKLFPVKPDYVGLSVATTSENYVKVEVEDGEITGAYLI